MSAPMDNSDELPRLLSALVDGTLEAADEERLAALLEADPAARAKYYDHVMLAAMLHREGRRAAAQSQEWNDGEPVQISRSGDRDSPRPALVDWKHRLSRWQWALATSILLGLLLSVGEATGVTEFVPTIIRIVTGEGSLVIEVDDPAVSVNLDGEDVTITGPGIHELRLRPGTHDFVATKAGQPIREDAVTIERGGRQVVKITREGAQPQTRLERLDESEARYAEVNRLIQLGTAAPGMAYDPWGAELHFRQAIELCDQLIRDFPEVPKYQKQSARCRRLLSMALNLQAHVLVYKKGELTADEITSAIAAATEATQLSPWDAGFWTNLGRANYRAKDWEAALAALEKGPSGADYNSCATRFFLAMTHWQLGNKREAQEFYNQAVEWMDQNKPNDTLLRRDRGEAEALLKQ